MPARLSGHRLETTSVRGGILAQCSCGVPYKPPTTPAAFRGRLIQRPERQVWETYERHKIKAAHQAHLSEVRTHDHTRSPEEGEA